MKTTIYNLDAAKTKVEKLNSLGVTFTYSKTSGSEKIEYTKNGITHKLFYVEDKNSEKFIQLINLIKNEITKNLANIENSPFSKIDNKRQYFEYNEIVYSVAKNIGEAHEFKDCYECDVTAAYYQAALYLGLISPKTFDLCTKTISKFERLKLLGSIASVKVISSYEGGQLIGSPEIKKNDKLRNAWFTICNVIDGCMKNFINILGENFIFYWVDGIYFKGSFKQGDVNNLNEINLKLDRLKKLFPFEWKITPIIKMEVLNKGYLELSLEKPNDRKSTFFPPNKKIKGFYLK